MKVLKYVKSVVIGIILFLFLSFTMSMTILMLNVNDYGVTKLGNTSFIYIRDELSSKNYKKGDLVLVEATRLDNIKVGDEIFAYKLDKNNNVSIDLGTVGEVHTSNDAISFENGIIYTSEFIAGKADKTYNTIGLLLSIVQSKWGFLFIILVPNFLLFIWVLAALLAEIKYGKEAK